MEKCILRDNDFNERGGSIPLSYSFHVTACAIGSSLWLSVCRFVNNPSGSSPFCTYISLYLVYGNVLCMIQTLIYIYSCNTVKVTKRTSQ